MRRRRLVNLRLVCSVFHPCFPPLVASSSRAPHPLLRPPAVLPTYLFRLPAVLTARCSSRSAPVHQLLFRRRWLSVLLLVLLIVLVSLLLARLRRPGRPAVSRRVAIIGEKIRSRPVVNPASFSRLREPADGCSADTALLVLVTSALANWERRQAIRDTWGGAEARATLHVRLLFLLGEGETAETRTVETEAERHGDILQEGFHDSYHNLTLKTMMGLRWAGESCTEAKFVVKTDDDIYWNLPLLLSHLESVKDTRFITGKVMTTADRALYSISAVLWQ